MSCLKGGWAGACPCPPLGAGGDCPGPGSGRGGEAARGACAALHDPAGSTRTFLSEAALPAVRALNRAGAPGLLPAIHRVLKAVRPGLVDPEAVL